MAKIKKIEIPAAPPQRKELSDNPIKLCNEISRIFRTRMREGGEAEGVMSQQGARLVLSLLAISDGLSQRELAERTHLRPPTVSVILRRMVDEGIAEIRADENDMRINRAYLTELGKKADRDNIDRIKTVDAMGLKGITEEESQMLMNLLIRIRENLLTGESKDEKDF